MLLSKIAIDANSQCWSFYNTVNARTATVHFAQPNREPMALTQRLSRLLLALAEFFRSKRTLCEVLMLWQTAKEVVIDFSAQVNQSSDTSSHATLGNPQDDLGTGNKLVAVGDRDLRAFKLALTLTLIINGVLSARFPERHDLTDFRREFANEISLKDAQLMPLGTGFIGIFLSHVWAIEEETKHSQAAWDMDGTEFAPRRSTTFFRNLENTLESLL